MDNMKMKIVLQILLFVFYVHSLELYDENVWKYIEKLSEENGAKNPNIIEPFVIKWTGEMQDPMVWHYLLPRVMFWDPMNQYPILLDKNLFCPEHNSLLTTGKWRITSTMRPRWIFDKNGPVVLIMRTYTCKSEGNSHHFLSGEFCITEQLPDCIDVPFVLSHRAGFTKNLQEDILQRIMSGVNFWNVEKQMTSDVIKKYASLQRQLCLETQSWNNLQRKRQHIHENFPHIQDYLTKYNPHPSNDYLQDIFLHHYNEEKMVYDYSFSRLQAQVLSCDHTFKVSVNIGFINPATESWTTQYDSLFMILNEYGQVLKYEFVKSTSFSNIEHSFQDLSNSLEQNVNLIMLDNCCHWKNKIQKLFPNVEVKLDLFHAVQRISKHLTKSSQFYKSIVRDLRLVFRQTGDVEKNRKMDTPYTTQISTAFQNFVSKWKDVKDNSDKLVLNAEALKACSNLKKHIDKGCLSQIPTGCGTNKNEKLHHFLNNSALSVGRIGPELAKALLCVLLYVWNSSRSPTNSTNAVYPIFSDYHDNNVQDACYFLQNRTAKPLIEVCLSPRHEKETDNSHQCLNPVLDEIESSVFTSTKKFHHILQATERNHKLYCSLDSLLWTTNNSNLLLKTSSQSSTGNKEYLEQNAAKLGMQVLSTPEDGNCLFFSVAYALQNIFYDLPHTSSLVNCLSDKVYDIGELSFTLRQCTVDEIIKNHQRYNNFFTDDETLSSIEKFRAPGTFEGNLGDFLISALCNFLCIPICVITSRTEIEVMLIESQNEHISSNPLFIAYNHCGPGHYSAVTSMETSTSEGHDATTSMQTESEILEKKVTHVKCRCGKSKPKSADGDKKFCIKTRCPCFKSNKLCSDLCACLQCDNPYGKKERKEKSTLTISSRRRRKNHAQFNKQSSHSYLVSQNERISQGKWSKLETFLLHKIVSSSTNRNKRPQTAVKSTSTYNKLVDALLTQYDIGTLRKKTIRQVQQKQRNIIDCASNFKNFI